MGNMAVLLKTFVLQLSAWQTENGCDLADSSFFSFSLPLPFFAGLDFDRFVAHSPQ
jgi:hypothetical protein